MAEAHPHSTPASLSRRASPGGSSASGHVRPTPAQERWLRRGLDQAGGKLPLFDENGRRVDPRIIQACLDKGWAEPWFANHLKPDWLVCKLTLDGRRIAARD